MLDGKRMFGLLDGSDPSGGTATSLPVATPQLLLEHLLKSLRLPTMLREYDNVARQGVTVEQHVSWKKGHGSDQETAGGIGLF